MATIASEIKSQVRFMGQEPEPGVLMNQADFIRAMNWYNYYYTNRDALPFLVKYMEANGYLKEEIDAIKAVPDWSIEFNLMSRARMLTRGFIFFEDDVDRFKQQLRGRIAKAIAWVSANRKDKVVRLPGGMTRDEIEYEKAGTVEEIVDEFLEYGGHTFKAYDHFRKTGIANKQVRILRDRYQRIIDELNDDEFQKELVSPMPLKLKKAYIKFLEGIVKDCDLYLNAKKVEKVVQRKPRKVKEKSADQLTKNVKYAKENAEFKLVSQPPSVIVGAQEVWLFNQKWRDLVVYRAKNEKGLTVKGSRVLEFDPGISGLKKLRKPELVLGELVKGNKNMAKRLFTGVKATEKKGNGRICENTLILKVFK